MFRRSNFSYAKDDFGKKENIKMLSELEDFVSLLGTYISRAVKI